MRTWSIIVLLLAVVASSEAWAQKDAGAAADPPAASLDAAVAAPVIVAPDAGVADAGVQAAGAVPRDGGPGHEVPPVVPAAPVTKRNPYVEWDVDGDGTIEPHEAELEKKAAEVFADVPKEVAPEELDARPRRGALRVKSLTVARFREMVKVTRAKVLARLSAEIERKGAARMITVSQVFALCSLSGLLLLLLPLFLARRYPGRRIVLFKYSVLAAITFMLTVSLFGAVSLLQRSAQAKLSNYTNPQLALASGFFDTLHADAKEHVVVGRELFAPTLTQLQGDTDEQPATVLMANGRRMVKSAEVFGQVAGALEVVTFVVGIIPSVLLSLSMVLFMLALKPTLIAIVELPAQAAAQDGAHGADVFKGSMKRVGQELLATFASLGVLVVITILAGAALSRVVQPVLAQLISYFTIAVMYLRLVEDASSGLVFVMLFSVILFLVLSLAMIVVATAFFLAKPHRIFQQRFSGGVPLGTHKKFWKRGSISVLWAMAFPLIYVIAARAGIEQINAQLLSGSHEADSVNWTLLMLAGPLLLVVGFVVALWASRALAAIRFLVRYDVEGGTAGALGVADGAAAIFGRP